MVKRSVYEAFSNDDKPPINKRLFERDDSFSKKEYKPRHDCDDHRPPKYEREDSFNKLSYKPESQYGKELKEREDSFSRIDSKPFS